MIRLACPASALDEHGERNQMNERYVQQEMEHRHFAEDKRRTDQLRRPPINGPKKNQGGAERHQKEQQ